MNIITKIFKRLRTDFYRAQYMKTVSKILNTAPVKPGNLPFVLLSMVHQRDVLSYLVAAKSFLKYAPAKRIVVVCDPSITAESRTTLKEQIPYIELRDAVEFTHPDIPRGGTWERLFAITSYAPDNYVIQLDADTLTLDDIPEVIRAITNNTGFVIGEVENQTVEKLNATSQRAKKWLKVTQHIQALVEADMDSLPLPKDSLYVRGCSGFTGFPCGSDIRKTMIEYSKIMTLHFGDKWNTWGTEQITSNYLVANSFGTQVLPFPKYGTPDVSNKMSVFIHFIGPMRFTSSSYQLGTASCIKQLLLA